MIKKRGNPPQQTRQLCSRIILSFELERRSGSWVAFGKFISCCGHRPDHIPNEAEPRPIGFVSFGKISKNDFGRLKVLRQGFLIANQNEHGVKTDMNIPLFFSTLQFYSS